ncbi:MAG: ABC transporter ATP-binding protein [Prosthecobacter sp.]|nr:ABC transporter ATP-binding protein [Prosthecobacter sp.]
MIATISDLDYRRQSAPVAARFDRIKQRPHVLDVVGLHKRFDASHGQVVALQDINFCVHRREFLCVIGQSGCGKSTLIRILAGLETPTEGQVLVDGKPVNGPGRDRGMVFQGYTLFPWLTVKQNVMFGPQMAGKSSSSAESEARQWISLVGLEKFENNYPHQLSGGMKQRVAIARALANEPRILLMDEPFGALDAQTRAQMQNYLLQIWKNIDITILFITHDLDEAIYLADRILVLDARPGRVKEIIEVPVPRPRGMEQFIEPEFLATKQRMQELIHPHSQHKDTHLPILRMTHAGDDVE